MKNLVAMMLALSFAGVGATSVLAADAETGKEVTKTTVTESKKPESKGKKTKTTEHVKKDVKVKGDKTTTEDSKKTETEAK